MDTSSPDFRKLRELVIRTEVAMLVTVDDEGELRSRPVQTLEFDDQGRLWFFTAADSPKVGELDNHHGTLNLAYADPASGNFASISGTGRLFRDTEKARSLWHKPAEIWFPKGVEDPRLLLLQVTISQAEYWDSPNSPVLRLWGLTKALVTGDRSGMGRSQKLDGPQSHQSLQRPDSGPHPQQYR